MQCLNYTALIQDFCELKKNKLFQKARHLSCRGTQGFTFYAFPFGFPSKDTHTIYVPSDKTPDTTTESRLANQKMCCDLLLSLCIHFTEQNDWKKHGQKVIANLFF